MLILHTTLLIIPMLRMYLNKLALSNKQMADPQVAVYWFYYQILSDNLLRLGASSE